MPKAFLIRKHRYWPPRESLESSSSDSNSEVSSSSARSASGIESETAIDLTSPTRVRNVRPSSPVSPKSDYEPINLIQNRESGNLSRSSSQDSEWPKLRFLERFSSSVFSGHDSALTAVAFMSHLTSAPFRNLTPTHKNRFSTSPEADVETDEERPLKLVCPKKNPACSTFPEADVKTDEERPLRFVCPKKNPAYRNIEFKSTAPVVPVQPQHSTLRTALQSTRPYYPPRVPVYNYPEADEPLSLSIKDCKSRTEVSLPQSRKYDVPLPLVKREPQSEPRTSYLPVSVIQTAPTSRYHASPYHRIPSPSQAISAPYHSISRSMHGYFPHQLSPTPAQTYRSYDDIATTTTHSPHSPAGYETSQTGRYIPSPSEASVSSSSSGQHSPAMRFLPPESVMALILNSRRTPSPAPESPRTTMNHRMDNLQARANVLEIPNEVVEYINGGHGMKNPNATRERSRTTSLSSQPGMVSSTESGQFSCSICGKGFLLQRLLNRHMKCHSDVKRYLCTFCGKGFNDTFDLKRHTRTHTGVRPYKCNHCEKSFTQRCSLESHTLKVHGITHQYAYKERRAKVYVCEECGSTSVDPEEHYLHLQKNHPMSPALMKFYDKRHFKFPNNNFPTMLLQTQD